LEISLEEGEAIIRANASRKSGPKTSKLLDRANNAANRGRYQQAAKLYLQYLITVPDSVEVRRNLGMAYLEMGVVDKAEQHVIEALRLEPNDAWSNLLLGNIYLKHKNGRDIADKFYQRAAAADPNDAHLLSNLGSMVGQEGKYDEARNWFNQAINIDPDLPNAYYGLALLEARQENHGAAIEALDRLFSRSLSTDIRSQPVYEESRRLYRNTNQSIAEKNHEILMAHIEERRDELESTSGVEIELIRDTSLTVLARTQIAWHHRQPRHVLRYKPGNPTITPHLIAHELEHIAMEQAARDADRNRLFITTPQTKEQMLKVIGSDVYKLRRTGLSSELLDEYITNLMVGFADRLFNMPLDMFIEFRLYHEQVELRPSQYISLYTVHQQTLKTLNDPEAKKLTPRHIYNATLAMDAGYAIFMDHLYNGRTDYSAAYRSSRHYSLGKKLFETWLEAMKNFQPGDEYELVDQVASELKVQGWYDWKQDEELPPEEGGGITNPELLELKEPAAVMYCLSALQRFEDMSRDEILGIVSEIAIMGQSGLDYASSDKKYSLQSVPRETFSGLQLMCLMYVGFKDVDPTVDVGVDLSGAYETALRLHNSA